METLDVNQMERIEGGNACSGLSYSAGLACAGAVLGGLVGAALFGPSCIGLGIASASECSS